MKKLSYILNIISLAVAAATLSYAYVALPGMQLFLQVGVGAVLLYILVAWLIGRKLKSWWEWSFYFFFLQLVPICASVALFMLTQMFLSPAAMGGRNEYEMVFSDVQFVQSVSAKRNGITPFETRECFNNSRNQLVADGKLVKVSSNSGYYVRTLSHSVPYLVPKAEVLLDDIANEFQKISGTKAKFGVTSVLRTKEDVKKLQKVNSNATTNSCHCYGTTFDISYSSFVPDVLNIKSNKELREHLSQALYNLRNKGRCYVKFESKQRCYHITVR